MEHGGQGGRRTGVGREEPHRELLRPRARAERVVLVGSREGLDGGPVGAVAVWACVRVCEGVSACVRVCEGVSGACEGVARVCVTAVCERVQGGAGVLVWRGVSIPEDSARTCRCCERRTGLWRPAASSTP